MDTDKVANAFQRWMKEQGYTRQYDTWGAWVKDGVFLLGKELHDKLEEWKKLNNKQT